jgi:LacI family transcriptional regulator
MGAYQAAHLAGLAIPEDLSVISVDNFEIIADSLYPALTSMELPHFQMGVWAVERLLALIENSEEDKEEPCEYLIGCPMVVRDSVAPLVK